MNLHERTKTRGFCIFTLSLCPHSLHLYTNTKTSLFMNIFLWSLAYRFNTHSTTNTTSIRHQRLWLPENEWFSWVSSCFIPRTTAYTQNETVQKLARSWPYFLDHWQDCQTQLGPWSLWIWKTYAYERMKTEDGRKSLWCSHLRTSP